MSITITAHAKIRLQQRGISHDVLRYLVEFGQAVYDHKGARVLYLNKRSREHIRQAAGADGFKRLESAMNVYAVMGCDGNVVTVGHRTQRIGRH